MALSLSLSLSLSLLLQYIEGRGPKTTVCKFKSGLIEGCCLEGKGQAPGETFSVVTLFSNIVYIIRSSMLSSDILCEQCIRLQLLLTTKESAIYVPTNLEARRRITFFANSLFMKMPRAPPVRSMMSFR
jgi:hypothetical protein